MITKMLRKPALLLMLGSLAFLSSCKKKTEDSMLPAQVQKIVSKEILDALKSKGFVINEGLTPPSVEGVFVINPNTLSSSTLSGDVVGTVYNTQRIRLSNQKNADFSLMLDWKETNSSGNGLGGFIAGDGSKFTVFFESTNVLSGVSFKDLRIYSGEMTPSGIKDLQWAFYLKEKGSDPSGKVVEVGTSRVFNDSDKISEKASSYRLGSDTNDDSKPNSNAARD